MNTYIFHTVNAGLFFWDGKNGLLVDGIHRGKEEGFSDMPEHLQMQLQSHTGIFGLSNQILFTHLHYDHFDSDRLGHMLKKYPAPRIYGSGLSASNIREIPVTPQVRKLALPSGNVYVKNTIHEGEKFRQDPHQSFLIKRNKESFFVAGDAVLTPEDARAFSSVIHEPITAGFFNLYQLCSKEGEEFVRSLPIERVFLYHLPLPEDDPYNYIRLAHQKAKHTPTGLPKAEIISSLSWIDERIPQHIFDSKPTENTKKMFQTTYTHQKGEAYAVL